MGTTHIHTCKTTVYSVHTQFKMIRSSVIPLIRGLDVVTIAVLPLRPATLMPPFRKNNYHLEVCMTPETRDTKSFCCQRSSGEGLSDNNPQD